MVKIAILFTGQYRTFPRTWKIILEHLLVPNDATAFIYGESNSPDYASTDIEAKWKDYVGDCNIHTTTRTLDYNRIIEYLKATKPALQGNFLQRSGINPNYVFQSGSIIEYYQYMKAFDMMLQYERKHDISFTHIVRTRLDVVFTVPLKLRDFFQSDLDTMEELQFMSLNNELICSRHSENITDVRSNQSELPLTKRDCLWLFRKNVVWIGARPVMERLYPLVYFYGSYMNDSVWCFNSETQFNEYCLAHNITSIDLLTPVEEEYLTSRAKNTGLLDGIELTKDYDKRLVMTIVRDPNFHFDR